VQVVARPWREAGRTELTTRTVEQRLNAYVTALMGPADSSAAPRGVSHV
jgi:hypothetical protein